MKWSAKAAVLLVGLTAACTENDNSHYSPAFKSALFIYGYVQSEVPFLSECILVDHQRAPVYLKLMEWHQRMASPIIERIKIIWLGELERRHEPAEGVIRLLSSPIVASSPDKLAMEDPVAFVDTCREMSGADDNATIGKLRQLYPAQMHDIDAWR
jgi:hypothetical protein